MSLDDAKHLVWLIANRDRLCEVHMKFPRMENAAEDYYKSVVDLHKFIISLVKEHN